MKKILLPTMKNIAALFGFIITPMLSYSQVSISNTDEISKIKTGTTFFAMKDPASPKAAAYVDAILKNWTINKAECIKYTDVEKNIATNNSFVTITADMTTFKSNSNTDTHIFMELWTTNGNFKYDPKKRKHFNQEDKITIATVEIFPDFTTQFNPSSIYKMDYDTGGHFKNWNAGIVGNYIQQLDLLINKGETRLAKTDFYNKDEIGKLNSQTLYFPDYVLTKFAKNSDDESTISESKEIFEGYNLPYKQISMEELSGKILNDETAFYYLLLIKTISEKFITVTNSKTGEIIYSSYSGSPSNIKSADLKELMKDIQKK